MIGAIVGDIVGSIYEFDNIKTKDFELFDQDCIFTDDTVMTIAVGKALKLWNHNGDSFGGRLTYDLAKSQEKNYLCSRRLFYSISFVDSHIFFWNTTVCNVRRNSITC